MVPHGSFHATTSDWTNPPKWCIIPSEVSSKGGKRLATHRSALKRIRSSEKKRQRNQIFRSSARTEESEAAVRKAISALDKAAQKGVIHKNNAARRKSRLMKMLNQESGY
jgi:small subunit ribosomal protein S20